MTVIGHSLSIRGQITSDEDIVVHGTVVGPIEARHGTVAVSETGRVDGDVRGTRVVVEGVVNGPILGSIKVELARTAKVAGRLTSSQVVMWDGALFQGAIDMSR